MTPTTSAQSLTGDTSADGTEPGGRIGSVCSGYGGLELGLMAVIGGSVAWHVEYDKHPAAVLEARFPSVPNYGDITATDWTQVEPVDWLTAGYPCQPFSYAGKRKGKDDDRHLWPAVAHAIGVLRPRRVLLENVTGHISMGLDAVLADLAAMGYVGRYGVVRASDAGACHVRARLFVTASDARRLPGHAGGIAAPRQAQGGRPCSQLAGRGGAPVADAEERPGDEEHDTGARPTPGGATRLQGAAGGGDHTPADTDSSGSEARSGRPGTGDARRLQPVECGGTDWGRFAPAIRRWESVLGRPAPAPTERGRGTERLSARFVEWMQGLPDGWVTDVLPRNPALKCLGNGVVPQQASLAVQTLLNLESVAA